MHVVDIHCLQHYTFVPVHPLPAEMENPLQRKEEENTIYHMDRGNGTMVRGGMRGMRRSKKKKNTNLLNQGWTRCSFNSVWERSWEATFSRIYSRSSLWRAALAACVSKEWIWHSINNWCASKHWHYAHMMRMYTFSPWMMHSLALLITLDKWNITFFILVIPTGSLCRWKERTNLEMLRVITKRHVSNLCSVSREQCTAKHCS